MSKDKAKGPRGDKGRPAANPPAAAATTAPDRASRLAPWAVVLLVIVATMAVRVRLLELPLERDEGEYAYAGQLMLEGVPPYKEAYNMKFPGVYAAYAGLMAVFGQTTGGIHMGLAIANAATIVLVFLLARRLTSAWAGAGAAAAYAVLSTSPTVLGLAGHATHFVVLAALGGLVLLLRGLSKGGYLVFLWSGLCLGVAVMMKQPGAAFALVAGLYLVWAALSVRPIRWLRSLAQGGLLVAGTLVPFGLTCLALYWAGVFERFWFWTFTYAAQYATVMPFDDGMTMLREVFADRMGPAAGLWVLAGLGLAGLIVMALARRSRKAADAAVFLSLLAPLSFVATGASLFWREHYFILMLPAVAILAGATAGLGRELLARIGEPRRWMVLLLFVLAAAFVQVLWSLPQLLSGAEPYSYLGLALAIVAGFVVGMLCELLAKNAGPKGRGVVLAGLAPAVFVLVFGYAAWAQRGPFLRMTPVEVCRMMYGGNPFPESYPVAEYLKDHTREGDRIAVIGSEPQIFFFAHRRSATGYIYVYSLMEKQAYARPMQEEMIKELAAAPPEYVVVVGIPTSWLRQTGSDPLLFTWLDKGFLPKYEVVGIIDLVCGPETGMKWVDLQRWGSDAAKGPLSQYHVLVLRAHGR